MTPTLQNVAEMLDMIGLDVQIMHVAQGWTRVFVTDRRDRCQLGRIMFRDGEYQHPHRYGSNFMEHNVRDERYFQDAWECLVETGCVLSRDEWQAMREEAKREAHARREEELAARAVLDAEKPLGMRLNKHTQQMVAKRRRKIEPPNVLGQMYRPIQRWIDEHKGAP